MTEKQEMNEMELDMVAGGVDIKEAADKLYKFGLDVWKWLHLH